jgi:NADH pyrophosphatase NudC (nudix superfamily)
MTRRSGLPLVGRFPALAQLQRTLEYANVTPQARRRSKAVCYSAQKDRLPAIDGTFPRHSCYCDAMANEPDVRDVEIAVERLREIVARYRLRLQEAYDRIAALDRRARHCPHCGHTALRMIPGALEKDAQCLSCNKVFSLTSLEGTPTH